MNRNLLIAIGVLILGAGFLVVLSLSHKPSAPITPQPTKAPAPTPTPTPKQLMVPLSEENKSGEAGVATITEGNGKLMVSLVMTGAPAGVSQPAHIHAGKCPAVGAIKYSLTSLVDGKSDTTLDKVTSIDELLTQLPLAINIHKSTASPSLYVSCGVIQAEGAAMQVSPSVTGMMHITPTVSNSMMHVTPSITGMMHTTGTVTPSTTQ